MKIKLELSTGKKIKLTMGEYEELKAFLSEPVKIPWYTEPYSPWADYPTYIWGTCSATTTTYDERAGV